MRSGPKPAIDRDLHRTAPPSRGKKPVTRLKTVVFPEPFGPINPVMLPVGTESEHESTATTPPKRLERFWTSSRLMVMLPVALPALPRPVGHGGATGGRGRRPRE